jgi:hypothetical protein
MGPRRDMAMSATWCTEGKRRGESLTKASVTNGVAEGLFENKGT